MEISSVWDNKKIRNKNPEVTKTKNLKSVICVAISRISQVSKNKMNVKNPDAKRILMGTVSRNIG